jgi:hypothetical protein
MLKCALPIINGTHPLHIRTCALLIINGNLHIRCALLIINGTHPSHTYLCPSLNRALPYNCDLAASIRMHTADACILPVKVASTPASTRILPVKVASTPASTHIRFLLLVFVLFPLILLLLTVWYTSSNTHYSCAKCCFSRGSLLEFCGAVLMFVVYVANGNSTQIIWFSFTIIT